MQIRAARESDLAAVAGLWQDRLALLQQADAMTIPVANAAAAWVGRAQAWLLAADCLFEVAAKGAEIIGFIVATVENGPPGLQPARLGVVKAMAVDLHRTHPNLGGKLLGRAKVWMTRRGVDVLEVTAPAHYPVEDAFWRGQGAQLRSNVFWLTL